MRKIKFRGRDVDTGRMVYGCFIVGRSGQPCIATNYTAAYEVQPDSVAQLVGFDVNGHEVYEGDTVVIESKYGRAKFTAHLRGLATNAGGVSLTKNQMKMARWVDERDS